MRVAPGALAASEDARLATADRERPTMTVKTIDRRPIGINMADGENDLSATLARHDTAIQSLGGRMHGVESGLKTLQGEVHQGITKLSGENSSIKEALASLGSKFDSRPTFDAHRTIQSIAYLAGLFSLVVGGIIWVTNNQFAGVVAEQKAFNGTVNKLLDRHDTRIQSNENRVLKVEDIIGDWATSIKRGARR